MKHLDRPFVKNQDEDAMAIYRDESARLETFKKWPLERPTPQDLARAGFYFAPSSQSADRVICYVCGKILCGWEPNDDVM